MSGLTVAQLAQLCGGEAAGDTQRLITGANALENAGPCDLSFAANRKAQGISLASKAGCVLVPETFEGQGAWSAIRVADPRAAFAGCLAALYPKVAPVAWTHPTAIVAAGAFIGRDCFIGAHATIGERSRIAEGCSIGSNCAIGDDVEIGGGTKLYANVTVYERVRIGARVILHSGCVLGADGFGFALADGRYEKFPQVGTVEIEDDVEIGANACVDRAALGVTRIRQGTKIDNLVHVGHNCEIGRHVVIAAQTGFSGGVTVGDYAVIGGQAGIGEKARIDAKAVVGGKAGVLVGQHVGAGEPVWGIPARPLRQHLRGLALVRRLPELRDELAEIRRKLDALKGRAKDE